MNEQDEKMSYAEAVSFLGIKATTLYNAVSRGVLTPLPRKGLRNYLPAKQVRLFKGKPLALSILTPEEGKIWQEAAVIARGQQTTPVQATVIPYLTDARAGEEMGERFGRNYARSAYKGILEYDPGLESGLARPLAS